MAKAEGFDIVDHISKLQKLTALDENNLKVLDEDFVMILVTSLPESWDQYTWCRAATNPPYHRINWLLSYIQLEEDSKRGETRKCFNCSKEGHGHIKEDCASKEEAGKG